MGPTRPVSKERDCFPWHVDGGEESRRGSGEGEQGEEWREEEKEVKKEGKRSKGRRGWRREQNPSDLKKGLLEARVLHDELLHL